jgi:uncharacterized RDD family membrane protein YckC
VLEGFSAILLGAALFALILYVHRRRAPRYNVDPAALAPILPRAAAFFLDMLIIWAGTSLLASLSLGMAVPAGPVAAWLYFAFFESSGRQATPGKSALGLIVAGPDSRKIGFGRASIRFAAKLVSGMFLGLGFLMALVTQRRQALHDLAAETVVLTRSKL